MVDGHILSDADCYLYDPTQKAAREYVWSRLAAGYVRHGIHTFWLDASEAESAEPASQVGSDTGWYSAGAASAVAMMFPFFHAQMVYEGLEREPSQSGLFAAHDGHGGPVALARSSWAGMSRYYYYRYV